MRLDEYGLLQHRLILLHQACEFLMNNMVTVVSIIDNQIAYRSSVGLV